MKISNYMVHEAYLYGKKVYNNEITRNEAKFEINRLTKMNIGSANDYITVFLAMMSGEGYRRTINEYATKYYLENIKKDFGEEMFRKALKAVEQHVKYYNNLGNGNLNSIECIIDEYK